MKVATYTLRELAYELKWSHTSIATAARELIEAGQLRKRAKRERWRLTEEEAERVKAWLNRERPEKEGYSLRDVADTLGGVFTVREVSAAARKLGRAGEIRERPRGKGNRRAFDVGEVIKIRNYLEAKRAGHN